MGTISSTFRQDCACDFLKIDEKIVGVCRRGVVADLKDLEYDIDQYQYQQAHSPQNTKMELLFWVFV